MLVYGDQRETVDPSQWLQRVQSEIVLAAKMPPGLERHSKLVGILIESGQLLQAVADSGCVCRPLEQLVCAFAQAVVRSGDSGFQSTGELPAVPQMTLPPLVELRVPEGYAFYAVYPEAYVAAARKLRLLAPPRVIGIRSIGTSLGAVVAAALGAPTPLTVRPIGHPFARQVEFGSEQVDANAHYVIVDEGPGLSGSSFGAVADALERRGVPTDRIAFVPSHRGDPGTKTSGPHRARWQTAQRMAAEFDPAFLIERFGPLETFVTGEMWERTKFLGRFGGRKVLLKFAGLGRIGEQKLKMARRLHEAGLSPEPLELAHGFLVEIWREDAFPLSPDDKPVVEIGRYIGTRARMFPAEQGSGASLEALLSMCRRNLSLAIGEDAAEGVDRWIPAPTAFERVRTDNKMDREEWLRLRGGRLLKTDALDHHRAHDLVGCQDMAWDVAGAIIEFALGEQDAGDLVRASEIASSRRVSPALLAFYRVAYCCFRLGQSRLAADQQMDGAERERLRSRAGGYETAVIQLLR